MNLKRLLGGDRFGLVVDLRSMADRTMHGSGVRLVNTTDGVQLELEREKSSAPGDMNCYVFVISDVQFNILGNQLESMRIKNNGPVQYPFQRAHSWPHELRQDAVFCEPALRPVPQQV